MTNCRPTTAKIIKGSEASFNLFLQDESERPVDLSQFNAGKLVFCNCSGVRTEITLTVPGTSPGSGKIAVTIPSADADNADEKWQSGEVELTKVAGGTKIVILKNAFEIVERICPPAP